jgi:hypothetical protein
MMIIEEIAMADNTEAYEAGKNYLTEKIVSISNISRDNLSWNQPPDQDGYELIITSGGKPHVYVIPGLDLIDTQRRGQLDDLAECIVRDFSR